MTLLLRKILAFLYFRRIFQNLSLLSSCNLIPWNANFSYALLKVTIQFNSNKFYGFSHLKFYNLLTHLHNQRVAFCSSFDLIFFYFLQEYFYVTFPNIHIYCNSNFRPNYFSYTVITFNFLIIVFFFIIVLFCHFYCFYL